MVTPEENIYGLRQAMVWFLSDKVWKCATGSATVQMLTEFGTEYIKLHNFWPSLKHKINTNKTNITSNKYSSQSTQVLINNERKTMLHIASCVFWCCHIGPHKYIPPDNNSCTNFICKGLHISSTFILLLLTFWHRNLAFKF
jgi:hypothetical protein